MLSPKRTNMKNIIVVVYVEKLRGNEVSFGEYGLGIRTPTWITSRQIEAARRTITRYTKRLVPLATMDSIFPDKTVTTETAESREFR